MRNWDVYLPHQKGPEMLPAKCWFKAKVVDRKVCYVLMVSNGFVSIGYYLVGGLATMLKQRRSVPFGIVLDRMEEYPHEIKCIPADRVPSVVMWFRKHSKQKLAEHFAK
jgi:hypothetical protein